MVIHANHLLVRKGIEWGLQFKGTEILIGKEFVYLQRPKGILDLKAPGL
jgi:hypothetical protein